jgi:hypothetical protein
MARAKWRFDFCGRAWMQCPSLKTALSMSSKKQRPSTTISDRDIRGRLNRALLRFTANVQPPFHIDHEKKFLSYQSDFLGFLRLGKYKDEIGRILKVCVTGPPLEGQYFTARLTRDKDESIPKPIVSLKPGAEWTDVRAEAAARLQAVVQVYRHLCEETLNHRAYHQPLIQMEPFNEIVGKQNLIN